MTRVSGNDAALTCYPSLMGSNKTPVKKATNLNGLLLVAGAIFSSTIIVYSLLPVIMWFSTYEIMSIVHVQWLSIYYELEHKRG